MGKIDFVIPWVDSNDCVWQSMKQKWELLLKEDMNLIGDSNADCRYRDGGLLKYW